MCAWCGSRTHNSDRRTCAAASTSLHASAAAAVAAQALAVWKLARRDRALSSKITKLAGSPCSYEPAAIRFSVNNSNAGADATARERRLGLSNRVLAGLLLHTWRTQPQRCPQSRRVAGAGRLAAPGALARLPDTCMHEMLMRLPLSLPLAGSARCSLAARDRWTRVHTVWTRSSRWARSTSTQVRRMQRECSALMRCLHSHTPGRCRCFFLCACRPVRP